jgi:hypothetical protein
MSEKVDHANAHVRKRDILVRNFMGGVAWGVGSVVGATLIVALVLGGLRSIGFFVPFVGDFVTQVVDYIETRR